MKRIATIVLSLVVALVPAAALGAQYDAPALTLDRTGLAKATVTVTTGPSGAPAGFTVQWMKHSDFLASGSQWVGFEEASFTGVPTLNIWGGSLTSFVLASDGAAMIEIGDLFDETGVAATSTDELESDANYIFRAFVNGDGSADASDYSPDLLGTTQPINCVFSQGYWKNHFSLWPVSALTIGGVVYTDTELLSILNTPAAGNGLISMSHQMIAALINIANGANPATVQATLDAADALISSSCGSDPIPPVGGCVIPSSSTSALNDTMDDFNNGNLGPPPCGPVGVEPDSWGSVKAGYR